MQKHLNELVQKEMSRKEFLATVGFGLASIFGLSTILRMLGHKPAHTAQGYGSSVYGGNKTHA